MSTVIKIPTRVVAVEKRQRLMRAFKKTDGEVLMEYEDLGWFVRLQGSYESLFVGHEEPTLKLGDQVTITIAKADQ